MMYTRERLMKAVREAGRDGRQFTLGEVRAELGIKSRDKREQKRFRSRFRECCQILGDNLERLGPNTFRLKAGYATAPSVQTVTPTITPTLAKTAVKAPKAQPQASTAKPGNQASLAKPGNQASLAKPGNQASLAKPGNQASLAKPGEQAPEADDAPVSLLDRVGVGTANDDEWKRRPREQVSFEKAPVEAPRALSLGARISTWFGRPARPQASAQSRQGAAIALSRLAVELQPKAGGFEYRWIDGKLEVQRANK